jgi:N-acyl-L-homoserine lactone synthetase
VTEAEILARGDAVARALLRWLEPLRFAEAADERQREASYRLRYKAILEVGMDDSARFPAEMERDEFDPDAVHIVAWSGAEPIATCRLVFPLPHRPLPFESVFGPLRDSPGPMVEWGRVAVDSQLRGEGGRIFMGLAARGWLAMRARGVCTVVGVTSERLVALFRALGFPIVVRGAPRRHWGVVRVPILCSGPAAVESLEHLWGMRESSRSGPVGGGPGPGAPPPPDST